MNIGRFGSLGSFIRWMTACLVVSVAVLGGFSSEVRAAACDAHATNLSSLTSAVNGVDPGDSICLASGTYNDWQGTTKAVMLIPEDGATPLMSLDFNCGGSTCTTSKVNGVTLDGLTITGGGIVGKTSNYLQISANEPKNITIKNSTFTGALAIDAVYNANILLDHNTHNDISFPGPLNNQDCATLPARVAFPYDSRPDQPATTGVTIQNSVFRGGDTDGIQSGAGITVLNNEFDSIEEGAALCALPPDAPPGTQKESPHTDPIQLIVAPHSVIRGNYIHDSSDGIVAYDEIYRATIEDNVVDLVSGRYGIELYSDDGSIVRHNTLKYGTGCAYVPCGYIIMDHKQDDPDGQGTEVYDNIATTVDENSGSTASRRDHNMLRQGVQSGDTLGTPEYVGGANPSTYAGYALLDGTPGTGAASDGLDVGIRVGPTVLIGDLDDSGTVDTADLDLLKTDYGKLVGVATTPTADLNHDGKIAIKDLSILLHNFGGQ